MELRILMVSHCLLNKGTRWWQEGKPLERNMGLAVEIVEFASKHNFGLVQMPCPEFTFCGNPRPSRTKDEYEVLPGFKRHCKRLARLVAEQIKTMVQMGRRPRIHVLAVIGVKRSPSCAVKSAIRKINNKQLRSEEVGVFMEMLELEISRIGLRPHFLEFDFDRPTGIVEELDKLLHEIQS